MARKPHHPPVPGNYERPWTDVPRYIHGADAIAGFGTRWFYVAVITRATANEMIMRHHYSHRIVNNSYVHLGVFLDGDLVGAMQFGYALNPAAMGRVVEGSSSTDYLELNRMWLSDVAPRNSESRAIAYSVRYIRAVMPRVSWIQSFADERCGGWGVVYQAANFLYVGCHRSTFYELDGEHYHKLLVTAHTKGGQRGALLRANLHRAKVCSFRQFRYVFFLRKSWRPRLRLEVQAYPKRDGGGAADRLSAATKFAAI